MKNKQTGRNKVTWFTRNHNRISKLEEQLQALQLQQVQLSLSQQQLQLQASLVQGLCDTLLAMKKLVMAYANPEQLKVLQAIEKLQEASQLHITPADPLLSAFAAAPISASKQDQPANEDPSSAARPQLPPPVLDSSCSIAPLSDPTAYTRQLLARAPVPGAESMTIEQVALLYREAVLQCAVLLHQMPQQSSQEQQAAVAELQQLWDRFLHAYLFVLVCGQQGHMEHLTVMNCSTLQEDAEGSAAALTRLPGVLTTLDMTQQQQEVMSAAYATCLRHQLPLTEERRQLQLQMAAGSSDCCMPVDGNSSSSSSAGSIDSTGDVPLLSEQHERRVQLHKQHQAVLQIHRLLQRDVYLRAASAFCILSCLSWEQLARWGVMSWPHIIRPTYLGKAVHELHTGQLQQSAQQLQ